MKLENARMQLHISRHGIEIALYDDDSHKTFLTASINPEDGYKAISGLVDRFPAKCEINHLDKIGKREEKGDITFPLPNDSHSYLNDRKSAAIEAAKKHTPKGWEADTYYGSRGSFYDKNGTTWARTTIRRWVEKD